MGLPGLNKVRAADGGDPASATGTGNAITLPCADYIMAGIYEVLADRAGKEE